MTTKSLVDSISKLPLSDHRRIGLRQSLFFFDSLSPGSCFFQPRGAYIYNKLIEYLRAEYRTSGYHEVITPNLYSPKLWQTSGHWDHYQSNIMKVQAGDREFSLKPMNCPGHCLMFKNNPIRSADKLPIRWADFGVLHRNELSGTLQGLTRVRRFQQDDAHIFCTPSQIETEVKLSLRPDQYMGDSATWDLAEDSLRGALKKAKLNWDEQEKEGAFYGPKIDLVVRDTLDRDHQCATIQLDFQLPERFGLAYRSQEVAEGEGSGEMRPVMIHRAIFGSVERFIAMIAENSNGRWPFWLSPLRAQIIPVHEDWNNYAKQVRDQLRSQGHWVDCDTRSGSRFGAKIREASMTPYHFILIVGPKEASTQSVTARLIRKPDGDESGGSSSESNADKENKGNKGSTAKNIILSIGELIDRFDSYEDGRVNRADLKLLESYL